jgi:oligopeptide transport system substrate-binding protein
MRKRLGWPLWLTAAGVIAVIVVGSAIGASSTLRSSDARTTLRVIEGAEPPSLDPGLATDTTSATILDNIDTQLIKLGPAPDYKPQPAAASSWSVKGANVTLHLNKALKWSNGKPVTAQDYVYSWLRTISPELGADYAYQFFDPGIVGAEAYNSCDPKTTNCNTLRAKVGIKAAGKYTLKVKLVSPQPWFIQQLSHNSFLPVYAPAVAKYGNKFTEPGNNVTDGPFNLTSWKHDASLTLVKNAKWYNAKSVKINKIVVTIITDGTTAENSYKAGNADANDQQLPPADIPAWKKNPEYKTWKSLGTYYYGFNVKKISDVNQRRAMALAIDRNAIIKYVAQGGQTPAPAMTPIGISGGPTIDAKSTLIKPTAQLAKAKALMAKVKNPVKNVNLYINNSPGHIQIATAIQAEWKELGISSNIKVQEWKQYLQFLGPPPNSDVDVYRLGWIYDYPDAFNGLSLWECNSGNNNTNWCNKKFDTLIEKAARTPNYSARTKLYQQAEAAITGPSGSMAIMPIYWYVFHGLVKPYVHNYFENVQGAYDWSIVSMS